MNRRILLLCNTVQTLIAQLAGTETYLPTERAVAGWNPVKGSAP